MSCVQTRLYLSLFFFFSPRLEEIQPVLLITHLGSPQVSDTYVTIIKVTQYIVIILLILGEVQKPSYLPFSYKEFRLRTNSTTFCSSTGPQVIRTQMNLLSKLREIFW